MDARNEPGRDRSPGERDRRYTVYLIIVALAGWALASYDLNLLVLTVPDISQDLNLSESRVGSLIFFVSAAQFIVTLFVGYGMDTLGRKRMWMLCLTAAALFTGLTFFVQSFWQLVAVRMLASAFAQSELAVSITLVNEQVTARRRGLLYSIVQGGWPLGVFLASGVYGLFIGYGWRTVFLLGIVPIIVVLIGRAFIRESDRYRHVQEVKEAREEGNEQRVRELLKEYDVNVEELEDVTVKQLFTSPGYIRRQLILLTIVWLFYSTSFVATNLYITDFLTRVKGFTGSQAGNLLLVSGGIGFLFYVLGGLLGERWGRREVLIGTGLLVAPLNLVFLFVQDFTLIAIVYFLIYQVTNGTWSGAGYAYQAESFPTRMRGTAVGFLGAMFAGGLLIGSAVWTLLITVTTPTVTWLVVAVGLALGQWMTLLLRRIPPGQELEAIST
ncbi:MAG TPA: MFS transporter, partial [Rubrobacteraceae bacterium]|nr:MFS transporter [Rubrobacteraceae bacterium]